MNDYVTTFVAEETRHAKPPVNDSQDGDASQPNWIDAVPMSDYPSVVALAEYLAEPDVEERFRFGMEILRTGLEARLAQKM